MLPNKLEQLVEKKKAISLKLLLNALFFSNIIMQDDITSSTPSCINNIIGKFTEYEELKIILLETDISIVKYLKKNKDISKLNLTQEEKASIESRCKKKKVLGGSLALYKFLPEELKLNRAISLKALEGNVLVYRYMPDSLKRDKNIALKALEMNVAIYHDFPDELKKDAEIGSIVIEKNPIGYKYFPEELKLEKEIAFKAVKSKVNLFKYVPKELKSDKDFIFKSVQANIDILDKISYKEFKKQVIEYFIGDIEEEKIDDVETKKLVKDEIDKLNIDSFQDYIPWNNTQKSHKSSSNIRIR